MARTQPPMIAHVVCAEHEDEKGIRLHVEARADRALAAGASGHPAVDRIQGQRDGDHGDQEGDGHRLGEGGDDHRRHDADQHRAGRRDGVRGSEPRARRCGEGRRRPARSRRAGRRPRPPIRPTTAARSARRRTARSPHRRPTRCRGTEPMPCCLRCSCVTYTVDTKSEQWMVHSDGMVHSEKPGTDEAVSFWTTGPGSGELRSEPLPEPADDEVLVRTRWTGISRGTETLVLRGEVPESEHDRMRAPFQSGSFPFPVKYGYLNVGVVEQGPQNLVGSTVFTLFPHQSAFVVPARRGHGRARLGACPARGAGRRGRDRGQRAVGCPPGARRPRDGDRRGHDRVLHRPARRRHPGRRGQRSSMSTRRRRRWLICSGSGSRRRNAQSRIATSSSRRAAHPRAWLVRSNWRPPTAR